MKLTASKGTRGKIRVEKRADDGTLVASDARAFEAASDWTKAAAALGVAEATLMVLIDTWRAGGGSSAVAGDVQTTPPVGGVPTPARFRVIVRPIAGTEAEGMEHWADDPVTTLMQAVASYNAAPGPEPVATWRGTKLLAAVDVDWHHGGSPDPHELDAAAEALSPRPRGYWRTHGGGLRAIYTADGNLEADELCGIAALWLAERFPSARIEVKDSTRLPQCPNAKGQIGSEPHWGPQGVDTGAIALWFGRREAGEAATEEWLQARGLQVGKRYGHDLCPVNPTHDGDKRSPVSVREGGIWCHYCAAVGVARGSAKPGWFPYSALCGGLSSGPIKKCVDSITHWEHAKYVISEETGLSEHIAKLAYSAALHLRHPSDPRVDIAFAAGTNFVRFEGRWGTLRGETYTKDPAAIIARLPAAMRNDAGEAKPVAELIARLSQPIDLTDLGYPALEPIFGARIWSHRLPMPRGAKTPVVLQGRALAPAHMAHLRARYLAPADRPYDEARAYAILEEGGVPGLDRSIIKLLVSARGCSEGQAGMPPMVFLSGPTSSAKSSSVALAAAIVGDSNKSVVWTSNVERVRGAIMEAKETGTFVTFNEITKEAKADGVAARQAMDFVLNLTPDSMSHKLYIGAVPLGAMPVCVWTDTAVPPELKQDAQLARRIIHARLPRKVDWQAPLRDAGTGRVENMRVSDPMRAEACDVILSGVIDEFFTYPMSFEEIARKLGYGTLADSEEAQEGTDALRALFGAVCRGASPTGSDAARWKGRGWKIVTRDLDGELGEAWRAVADPEFVSSRRCSEVDWAKVLGAPQPVELEIRPHGGSKAAIRFIARGQTRQDYKVNQECV